MADPSYVSSIVVKFPMMKYSNYIKGKIFFLIFWVQSVHIQGCSQNGNVGNFQHTLFNKSNACLIHRRQQYCISN